MENRLDKNITVKELKLINETRRK